MNKCDEQTLAQRSLNLLRTSLRQAQIVEDEADEKTPIFLTSAIKKTGIVELASHILRIAQNNNGDQSVSFEKPEIFFFRRWVNLEFGRFGLDFLDHIAATKLNKVKTYEQKKQLFIEAITNSVSTAPGTSEFLQRL